MLFLGDDERRGRIIRSLNDSYGKGGGFIYQALYRKYRPQIFSDVAGQPQVTKILENEVKIGRISHAYLFVGTRGTGKTTCAKILARAVNCLEPKDGNPCGACEPCLGALNETLLDILEIDAASNNGVNDIRALREEIHFRPASAKYRVYIIDEVHMLSTPAFNALLKTLEEPPPHVIFILATTEAHKLPATILSRCQRLDFGRIPVADIAARLLFVAKEERLSLTAEGAALIAGLAEGGMRDALSILDRVASFGGEINESAVSQIVGLTGSRRIFALYESVSEKDAAGALSAAHEIYNDSGEAIRIIQDLIGHYRNLMLLNSVDNAREFIVCSDDDFEQMRAFAKKISLPDILEKLRLLMAASEAVAKAGNPRAQMEISLMQLILGPPAAVAVNQPAERQQPESKPGQANTASAKPNAASSKKISPVTPARDMPPLPEPPPLEMNPPPDISPASTASASPGDGPFRQWPSVLQTVKAQNPLLSSILDGSSAELRGEHLLITSANATFPLMIKQGRNGEILRQVVAQVTGKPYKVGIKKAAPAEEKHDPLDDLLSRAAAAGIEIEE